jgi:hypothetical protein
MMLVVKSTRARGGERMVRTLVMSLTAVALAAGPLLAQAQQPAPRMPTPADCQALINQVLDETNNRLDYSADLARDKILEALQLKDSWPTHCIVKVQEAANFVQLTLKR